MTPAVAPLETLPVDDLADLTKLSAEALRSAYIAASTELLAAGDAIIAAGRGTDETLEVLRGADALSRRYRRAYDLECALATEALARTRLNRDKSLAPVADPGRWS